MPPKTKHDTQYYYNLIRNKGYHNTLFEKYVSVIYREYQLSILDSASDDDILRDLIHLYSGFDLIIDDLRDLILTKIKDKKQKHV